MSNQLAALNRPEGTGGSSTLNHGIKLANMVIYQQTDRHKVNNTRAGFPKVAAPLDQFSLWGLGCNPITCTRPLSAMAGRLRSRRHGPKWPGWRIIPVTHAPTSHATAPTTVPACVYRAVYPTLGRLDTHYPAGVAAIQFAGLLGYCASHRPAYHRPSQPSLIASSAPDLTKPQTLQVGIGR